MKLSPLLLASSLAANAALVIAFVVGSAGDSASTPSTSSDTSAAAAGAARRAGPPGQAGVDPKLWSKLPGNDWPALIASLRAKGYPPAVIRAILAAQIDEGFRARRKALEPTAGDTPFWKNPTRDPKMMAALRDLGREEQKILKDLFGTDPSADDPMSAVYEERRLGGVPAEKHDQVRQIMQQFDDLRNDIYERARGGGGTISILPDEQAKLNQLDLAQHAEIAKLLPPQELEDFDLRTSPTAESLRYQLTAFNATEDEFRALYRLQAAFDNQWGRLYSTPSQEEMRARGVAQGELLKQIETALGSDRFAAYQRATDYGYRQASTLVARLELPPETADQLYTVQKDVQKRMQTIATDRSLPPDQRTQQLAALAEEATTKVTAALGQRGFEAYKQNGGQWLQNLIPRPPAPPRN